MTINIPLGLHYGEQPALIEINGANLAVKDTQTLSFLGGDVIIDAGEIAASGGKIELGGLAARGKIDLNFTKTAVFPTDITLGNVTIDRGTVIDVSGDGGGIAIAADNFEMSGESKLNGGTKGLFPSSDSLINASSQFGLDGALEINSLNDNNSIGLLELPTEFVATQEQIVNACKSDRYNSFAVTGRGGLADNPAQTIRSRTLWQDLRPLQEH